MSVFPISAEAGAVTIWCTRCQLRSTDVDAFPTVVEYDQVVEISLTCPTCAASTKIKRTTPDDAIEQLAQPDMQAARSGRDINAPGEFTVSVAVLWNRLDNIGWDIDRRARHRETVNRWPL